MKKMIENIGNRIVTKIRLVNQAKRDENGSFYENNIRLNPFYSELQGMLQLLKTMDVEFEIDYDETVTYMTAITIMGQRFEA